MSADKESTRPTRRSTEWAIGWKIARLVYDLDTQKLAFWPIVYRGLIEAYGVEATATCNHFASHVPPQDDCHCGFNAFVEQVDAIGYVSMSRISPREANLTLLRVGLAGEVISGTMLRDDDRWGYRAGRQTITDIFIEPSCTACGVDLSGTPPTLYAREVCDLGIETYHAYARPYCVVCRPVDGVEVLPLACDGATLRWATIRLPEPASALDPWSLLYQEDELLDVQLSAETVSALKAASSIEGLNYATITNRVIQVLAVIERERHNGNIVVLTQPGKHRRFRRQTVETIEL